MEGVFRRAASTPPADGCSMELWSPGRAVPGAVSGTSCFIPGRWDPCQGVVQFVNKAGRQLCNGCVLWAEREARGISGGALRRADQPPMAKLAAPVPRVFYDRVLEAAQEQQIPVTDFIRAAVGEAVRRHEAKGEDGA